MEGRDDEKQTINEAYTKLHFYKFWEGEEVGREGYVHYVHFILKSWEGEVEKETFITFIF